MTRAWLLAQDIKPFKNNTPNSQYLPSLFSARINYATREAQKALELPLLERLKKYCFVNRYKPFQTNRKPKNKKVQEKRALMKTRQDSDISLKKQRADTSLKRGGSKGKFSRILSFMTSNSDNLSIATDDLNLNVFDNLTNLNWNN